jgi:hypothetical protein
LNLMMYRFIVLSPFLLVPVFDLPVQPAPISSVHAFAQFPAVRVPCRPDPFGLGRTGRLLVRPVHAFVPLFCRSPSGSEGAFAPSVWPLLFVPADVHQELSQCQLICRVLNDRFN